MVCSSPNRYIIGLCSLLLVFVISIAFANIFPYQDTFSATADHHHTIATGAGIRASADDNDGSIEQKNHGVVLIDSYIPLSTSDETVEDIYIFESAEDTSTWTSTSSMIKSSDKTTVPDTSMPNLIDNNNILEAEAADEQPDSTINIDNDANDIDLPLDEDILQRCIYSLKHANLNSNNMMDTYEYIIFLKNLIKSSKLYDEIEELKFYNDLPEELINNFESLSCLCSFALCCIDGIGIYIDNNDDGSLETICVDTMNVIEETLG